jgi:hypothetical protein
MSASKDLAELMTEVAELPETSPTSAALLRSAIDHPPITGWPVLIEDEWTDDLAPDDAPYLMEPCSDGDDDDEGGDEDSDADDEDADDEDADDGADSAETIANLRKELKAAKAQKRKANAEAAAARLKAKPTEGADTERTERLEHEIKVRDAVEALREEGVTGKTSRVREIAKLLKSIEEGQIEDSIDALKEDFPEFFKPEKTAGDPPPRPPRVRGGGTAGTDKAPPSAISAASQAMLDMGRRRR